MKRLCPTHLSLFTGIGGLDLAAEWAGFRTVGQCEWAEYPARVLEKHWPDVPRWRDIRTLTKEDFYARTGLRTVDCISGGVPCQPHSVAGKRKASCDGRDLWPEMRRVIGEIEPEWVVAENVRGLLSSEAGRFFRGVLRDFAALGYTVGWGVIRASDAGAVHRRERVAIVAHADRQSVHGIRLYDGKEFLRTKNACPSEWDAAFRVSEQSGDTGGRFYAWNDEPVKPLVTRADDGFSGAMDRNRCLGNAVVPQQFYPVFDAIRKGMEEENEGIQGIQ